jgi:hypothetical protein
MITHDTPQSVGLLWTSDQPVAETSTPDNTHNTYNRQTSMPPAGFEHAIPAGNRPHTHALDRSAIGIGCKLWSPNQNYRHTLGLHTLWSLKHKYSQTAGKIIFPSQVL